MHEMGIALEIIDIVKSSLPADLPDARVERINLRVGKLSAIVPESLRFCFGVAVKDTNIDGAVLNIEEVPVLARCNDCGHEWVIDQPFFKCPECESGSVAMLSGKELDIVSIEIEDKEA